MLGKSFVLFCLIASAAWAAELSGAKKEEKKVTFDLSNIEKPTGKSPSTSGTRSRPQLSKRSSVAQFSPEHKVASGRFTERMPKLAKDEEGANLQGASSGKKATRKNVTGPKFKADRLYAIKESACSSQEEEHLTSECAMAPSSFKPITNLTELQASIKDGFRVGVLFTSSLSYAPSECRQLADGKGSLSLHRTITFLEVDIANVESGNFHGIMQAHGITSLPSFLLFQEGMLQQHLVQPGLDSIEQALQQM